MRAGRGHWRSKGRERLLGFVFPKVLLKPKALFLCLEGRQCAYHPSKVSSALQRSLKALIAAARCKNGSGSISSCRHLSKQPLSQKAGFDGLTGCAVFARNHEDSQLAKKKKSNIQIGKEEVKLSLPTEDTILYVESPKAPRPPPPHSFILKFRKAAVNTVNTARLAALLCTKKELCKRGDRKNQPISINTTTPALWRQT